DRLAERAPIDVLQIAKWQVVYGDTQLGEVRGTASVDWEERRAHVLLTQGGTEYSLAAFDVELTRGSGGQQAVTMTLGGRSPASAAVTGPDTSAAGEVGAADGARVSMKPRSGGAALEVSVGLKALPD